ncbi:hypothetical protein NUM_50770 [Actinocatenispora comari]|uniref:Amidohydrolase-related domain-containing protein n=1 Tax=Actinocatenispora comari TaxID=2807577 RepID=A0A8J4AJD3_9ACTN|nr:hypothetical protein NUM_50770 [Actinocatenispora comari]
MTATLITGASVWDGIADTAVPRQVLVVGDRIERIAETIDAPPGAETIDLPGHTLTPGFIDCHTHVGLTPNLLELGPLSSPAKTLRALPILEALLDNGFTTIRDLGCGDVDHPTIDLRNAIAAGLVRGPRMLVAPHILSARGGHGDFSANLADQYQPGIRGLEFATADGPDEIRTLVRQEIRAGADWIKFAATGGFSSPSDDPNTPPTASRRWTRWSPPRPTSACRSPRTATATRRPGARCGPGCAASTTATWSPPRGWR